MGVLLLMKMAFGPHSRAGADCQGDQACDLRVGSVPHSDLWGRDRGWRLNQPMASDLVNHDYIMKPP